MIIQGQVDGVAGRRMIHRDDHERKEARRPAGILVLTSGLSKFHLPPSGSVCCANVGGIQVGENYDQFCIDAK